MFEYIAYFSIFLPGLIGIIRFRKIDRLYHPILGYIWLTCLNEVVSYVMILNGHYTFINNNIYSLPEFLLFLAFFRNSRTLGKRVYSLVALFFIGLWIVDCLVLKKLTNTVCNYFNLSAYFVIVMLSINKINDLISSLKTKLQTNSTFILVTAFIIFFTYSILIQAFWSYGLSHTENKWAFLSALNNVLSYIILFTYCLYSIAILLMPQKEPFRKELY